MQKLTDCLLNFHHRNQTISALSYKRNSTWQQLTWKNYFDRIETCAKSLWHLGVRAEDRVCLISETCVEWALIDWSSMALGAIVVPIYPTLADDDLAFILKQTTPKVVFAANHSIALKVLRAVPDLDCTLVVLRSGQRVTGDGLAQAIPFRTFEILSENVQEGKDFLASHCRTRDTNEVISIVYTSGTTGQPKGVVLTHQQALSEVVEAFDMVGVTKEDRSLSFLPYSHILGRIELWGHGVVGFQMAMSSGLDQLKEEFQQIQPTIAVAVPRIFEKIFHSIQTEMQNTFLSRLVSRWSLSQGYKLSRKIQQGAQVPLQSYLQYALARQLVLKRIQQTLGGKLRFAIAGGAPLSVEVATFFHAVGILVLEGYGLTETTGAITVNSPFDYEIGTVGKPIGDVKIKFGDDGEIFVQSKKVLHGYFTPESTTRISTPTESWFATGDIGYLNARGCLVLTDRKKDLIKTAGGKYVSPQKIEQLALKHSLISHFVVFGDQQKYAVGLVTLNFSQCEKLFNTRDIEDARVQKAVREIVAEMNTHLASFEAIKRFLVLPTELSLEQGDLTPSLKVKRKALASKYKAEIASLY